ncbi:hypothetical protein PQQ51_05625 [Paraburkholderia xenovorans]|uniref:hypothetical protein n=1 Tax=Paraburkholderia xenovorans TaxID=36873 RepID=UPI0038BCAFCE
MRLVFRIDPGSIASQAVICTAMALLMAFSANVHAQDPVLAQSATLAETADAGSATLASPSLAAVVPPDSTAAAKGPVNGSASGQLSADAFVNDFSLDDQALSRQRGGAVGMVMVAATPQLMRGNASGSTVTLWDEIAPPSPLPIPVDAARAAQGNVANYQRK